MSGQKGRSGGQRPGAGRKPQRTTFSERAQKKWISAANKFAKKHGITVEEAILDLIVKDDVQDSVRVAAAKLYNEALIEKTPVIDTNMPTIGPAICLPPLRPDPALSIVKD